jgi:hypothetical protein
VSLETRRQKVIAQYEGIVKCLEEQGQTGTDRHTLAVEVLHTLKESGSWETRTKGRPKP